jgi:DNA-binding MarR family transcriptional regulator
MKQKAAESRALGASQQLADELVVLAIRFTRKLRALTPPVELSGPEISALAVLVHGGRATIGKLSKMEEVRSPSMTRLIQKLEARGFVHRLSDAEDRRLQWIEATPAGREHFLAGHRRRLQPLVNVLENLSADERESLATALPLLKRVLSLEDASD